MRELVIGIMDGTEFRIPEEEIKYHQIDENAIWVQKKDETAFLFPMVNIKYAILMRAGD